MAWSLADTACQYLDAAQRNIAFVAIGGGETFLAICLLLDVIAREGLDMPVGLVGRLSNWIDAYTDHDEEPRLRRLAHRAVRNTCNDWTISAQQRGWLSDSAIELPSVHPSPTRQE